MKTTYILISIGLIFILILLNGCVKSSTTDISLLSIDKDYKIISEMDYNSKQHYQFCGFGGTYEKKGSYIGYNFILTDKDTNEKLDGEIFLFFGKSPYDSPVSYSTEDHSEDYICDKRVESKAIISAFSNGYAPITFEFEFPLNKLLTIKIPLTKSCSGGPSCFDNINLWAKRVMNQTQYIDEVKYSINRTINGSFNLGKVDYELQCLECKQVGFDGFSPSENSSRGRDYIKAKGVLKSGSEFELYLYWASNFHGGSSGACFKSNDDVLLAIVKENLCISNPYFTSETTEECLNGAFETTEGNQKVISFVQSSSRDIPTIYGAGDTICLEK